MMKIVGWGLFCACSWTWCIGMFLPVLMLDRFGWAGFVVFAIPNVIGCTAVGYIIQSAERSGDFVRRHERLMRAFSWTTIGYHLLFAGLVAIMFFPDYVSASLVVIAAIAVLTPAVVLSVLPAGGWPVLAMMVYAMSLVTFASLGTGGFVEYGWHGGRPLDDLWWLAPVVAFGFLLCPFLDLTLHRALQQSGSKHTFAVFGVAFALMIVLTAAYAFLVPDRLLEIVLVHMTAQSIFTVAAHLRALADDRQSIWSIEKARMDLLLAVGIIIVAVAIAVSATTVQDPFAAGVDWYLRYLVLYGLVFPAAFVWFVVAADRDVPETTGRRIAFMLFIIVALPFFELGFLRDYARFPLPALVVVVIAGLLFNRRTRTRRMKR